MIPSKLRIGLVPIGEVPDIVSRSIGEYILGYLNLDADILPTLDHPAYAFDHQRFQYNAATILKVLESEPFHEHTKVIGVLDVDIFIPIFARVFGEARQGGKCALVSIYSLRRNLDGSTPPISLLLERTAKVALHESGHLFDLFHCMDERCLMHFSGNLNDLDDVPLDFCRYCSTYFRDALHRQ